MSKPTGDVSIVEIDPLKITLSRARQICEIQLDAFAKDAIFHVAWGPKYTFDTRPVPQDRLYLYKRLVKVDSWRLWLQLRNVNLKMYAALQNNEPVGFCRFHVPQFAETTAPLLFRIKNFFIKLWYQGLCLWYFGGINVAPVGFPSALGDYFHEIERKFGLEVDDPESYRKSLVHADLEKAQYLRDDFIYCGLMCVKSSHHGLGIGRKLFNTAIQRIPKYAPVFSDGDISVQGPPKYALFASREGRSLYQSAGFEMVGEFERDIEGYKVDATAFMQLTGSLD